ncbi:hypothetical protein F66182_8286 [Fusarium sp. NRRL 66182]|nr:hypothetical protein F66182_8286 [Fusarium sp. NRRL 66182]
MADVERSFLIESFVKEAEILSNKIIQSREEEKKMQFSDIDQFCKHGLLEIDPEPSEKTLAVMKKLQAISKEYIEKTVNSANATQRDIVISLEQAGKSLEVKVREESEYRLRDSRRTADDALGQLKILKDKREHGRYASSAERAPSVASEQARSRRGRSRGDDSVPGSAGLSFEKAHDSTTKSLKEPATPPRSPPSVHSWGREVEPREGNPSPLGSGSPLPGSFSNSEPIQTTTKAASLRKLRKVSSCKRSPLSHRGPISPTSPTSQRSPVSQRSPLFQRALPFNAENVESSLSKELTIAESLWETPGNDEFGGMDAMMRDLFQTGSELNDEYKESFTASDGADLNEWKTEDDEFGALYGELRTMKNDFETTRNMLRKQKKIIKEQKSQIGKFEEETQGLEEKNRELETTKQSLEEEKQDLVERMKELEDHHRFLMYRHKRGQASTYDTPVSSRGVKSTALSGLAGTMALANAAGSSWQSLEGHKIRLRAAMERCNLEEDEFDRKMAVYQDNNVEVSGKQIPEASVCPSTQHREDFRETIEFFDEIERSDNIPGRAEQEMKYISALSDELGEQTPGTATMQFVTYLPKPYDCPDSGASSHESGVNIGSIAPSSRRSSVDSMIYGPQMPFLMQVAHSAQNLVQLGSISEPDDRPETEDKPAAQNASESETPPESGGSEPEGNSNKEKGLEGNKSPESKDTPPNSEPSKSGNASTSGRGDDDPDAPDGKVLESPSSSANDRLLAKALQILQALLLVFVDMMKYQAASWAHMGRFVLLLVHYWCCWLARPTERATRHPPPMPSGGRFLTVTYHVLLVVILNTYLALYRERAIWLAANDITRRYMLKRAACASSWSFIYWIDWSMGLEQDAKMIWDFLFSTMGFHRLKPVGDFLLGLARVLLI